jgi:hypothetical protein
MLVSFHQFLVKVLVDATKKLLQKTFFFCGVSWKANGNANGYNFGKTFADIFGLWLRLFVSRTLVISSTSLVI